MNQHTFLTELKAALRGLPAADIADILGDCERHFLDGAAAGRSEADIARGMGDPRQMAAELRATARAEAYERKGSVGNLLRLVPALAGVLSFNLVMVFPAAVLLLLLLSAYLTSATAIVAGTFISASGVTGIDHIGITADNLVFQSRQERAAATAPESFGLDISNAGVQMSGAIVARPGDSGERFDLDLGGPARDVAPHPADRWRLLFGIAYVLFGVFLWRVSGRMGRALMRGLARYMRLNASMLKPRDPR